MHSHRCIEPGLGDAENYFVHGGREDLRWKEDVRKLSDASAKPLDHVATPVWKLLVNKKLLQP